MRKSHAALFTSWNTGMWEVIYTSIRLIEILIILLKDFQFDHNYFHVSYTFSFLTSNVRGTGVASWQWSRKAAHRFDSSNAVKPPPTLPKYCISYVVVGWSDWMQAYISIHFQHFHITILQNRWLMFSTSNNWAGMCGAKLMLFPHATYIYSTMHFSTMHFWYT
jgi:hypothetical protein